MRTIRTWGLPAVVLLVLLAFPQLVSLVTVPAAALLVWVAAQPLLVGVIIGAAVTRSRLHSGRARTGVRA
ncbi:hypothetical protein AB0910_12455 [Streptomyces sp. NPDC047002]|uniref:hypothetical protein n=1 Tax=Streptomyces sp. NPDC047002 TaxID=3155475 RepID=UPI0034560748